MSRKDGTKKATGKICINVTLKECQVEKDLLIKIPHKGGIKSEKYHIKMTL